MVSWPQKREEKQRFKLGIYCSLWYNRKQALPLDGAWTLLVDNRNLDYNVAVEK